MEILLPWILLFNMQVSNDTITIQFYTEKACLEAKSQVIGMQTHISDKYRITECIYRGEE